MALFSLAVTTGLGTASGGGVRVWQEGEFNMSDGTISNNTAIDGGGVYVDEDGEIAVAAGSFTNNTARQDGGGIYTEQRNTYENLNSIGTNAIFSGNSARILRLYDGENAIARALMNLQVIPTAGGNNFNIAQTSLAGQIEPTFPAEFIHPVNNFDINHHEERFREVTVYKRVEGEGGDRQKDFLFEVSIRDIFGNAFIPTARQWYGLLQANQLTYTRTGAGGAPVTTGNLSSLISAGSEVAAFTLRHGEEIVIQVPLHVLVDVKEILPTPLTRSMIPTYTLTAIQTGHLSTLLM